MGVACDDLESSAGDGSSVGGILAFDTVCHGDWVVSVVEAVGEGDELSILSVIRRA